MGGAWVVFAGDASRFAHCCKPDAALQAIENQLITNRRAGMYDAVPLVQAIA
jgi:hypothetical protein